MTPKPQSLGDTERLLKAVAERTRLRLLHLCARGEHSVGDLVSILGQSQPRVSRHLKILCDVGLLERFRDGHFVYFRVPLSGSGAERAFHLLKLTEQDSAQLSADRDRMLRVLADHKEPPQDPDFRQLNRLILDQFIAHPVGELLDVGVGDGGILRLLAGRATRAVGIDTDAKARRRTRRSIALAELSDCTIRAGDMYNLKFANQSFDTVVLDEVLLDSPSPSAVIAEARRVLRRAGRMLIIEKNDSGTSRDGAGLLADLCKQQKLRCAAIRHCFVGTSQYLLASAEPSEFTRKSA